jgi:hypothetical protein
VAVRRSVRDAPGGDVGVGARSGTSFRGVVGDRFPTVADPCGKAEFGAVRNLGPVSLLAALAVAASGLGSLVSADARSMAGEEMACTVVKALFAASHDVPVSRIAFCGHLTPDANPPGFYVLALQSTRKCEEPCSRLLGWFALQRATGRVFEWNVAEWELGQELTRHP